MNYNSQLATHVYSQLDEIKRLILTAETSAEKDYERIHYNINELYIENATRRLHIHDH